MSNMSATGFERFAAHAPALTEGQRTWRRAALALLSIRIIQGFIYWGGGSRRFIYDPSKLNPDAHTWMANKFQTAMPGALFGTDQLISFMLQHFYLLYAGVILFSAAELVVGAMLMAGILTRFAALISMGFSVLLMGHAMVSLDVRKPAAAADGRRLSQPGIRRAELCAGLRHCHLQLLSRIRPDALPQRAGQSDQASFLPE